LTYIFTIEPLWSSQPEPNSSFTSGIWTRKLKLLPTNFPRSQGFVPSQIPYLSGLVRDWELLPFPFNFGIFWGTFPGKRNQIFPDFLLLGVRTLGLGCLNRVYRKGPFPGGKVNPFLWNPQTFSFPKKRFLGLGF